VGLAELVQVVPEGRLALLVFQPWSCSLV
jgi:hypothetical protein